MIEPKYQCDPCHPFTKDKCSFCIKIKLRAVEHARVIKAHFDILDREKRDDVFSIFNESDVAAADRFAA